MANLIGKSTVDRKKTADFTGKWRLQEMDEESFLRFFKAMDYSDPKAAMQFYKNGAQQEIVDKGDIVIINYPDPTAEGGRRVLDLTVGQLWVGKASMGIKSKIFATRQGNKLMLDSVIHHAIYVFQGDKMLFDMTHRGTGITARGVLVREKSKL